MSKYDEIMKLIKEHNCTNVYFDLDGVLADFSKALSDIMLGSGYENIEMNNESKYLSGLALEAKKYMWNKVEGADDFYEKLDLMEEGYEIFKKIKKDYPVKILSAVPKGFPEKATEQKIKWCKKYLGDVDVITVSIQDKNDVVDVSRAILIDDREKNISKWNIAGGIGYLYK